MIVQYLWMFIPLIFAHLLTDFPLQSEAAVLNKGKLPVLVRHGVTVGLLSYLFLGDITGWVIPIGITVSHILLDAWKLRSTKGTRLFRFMLDQSGHILIITLFAWAASYSELDPGGIWKNLFGRGYLLVLTFLSGVIFSVYAGSFIVELAFESLGIPGPENKQDPGMNPRDMQQGGGIPEGGRVIGYLERSLIYLFVLAGYPAGIGFLVAAKSIFRFGELTDSSRRSQAEYIIIGTLMSILIGTAIALLAAEAIQQILS